MHDYQHDHDHHLHHQHDSQGNIRVAFFLNLAFTLLEIVGGLLTNSIAILSDALHDLGDSLSLGIAWYLERLSKKKPDQQFTFGYARFSVLGALISSLILFGGSVLIIYRAVTRIFHPEAVNPTGMLILALIGIVVNGMAVLRLRKGKSLNERAVSWHLLEDVLGWVVVLFASIVMMFVDALIIDPLLSLGITLFILFNVAKNIKEVLHVLLQGVPGSFSVAAIEQEIVSNSSVLSVHHTHLWTLEGEKNLLSMHIVVPDEIGRQQLIELKQKIKTLLQERGIEHVTLEVDFASEECTAQNC